MSSEQSTVNSDLLRVGIFLGGLSSEKEISLESGRHIYNSLDSERFERVPIFVDAQARFWLIPESLLWMNTTADISEHLEENAERIFYEDLPGRIDFAFLGVHGKYVEDGCLQGLLELLDLPYNGSGVLSSALGMDKYFQRKIYQAAGLQVPRSVMIQEHEWNQSRDAAIARIEREVNFPCMIKPTREGCSTALAKVKSAGEIAVALNDAFKWDATALAEEFLGDGAMEVTTTVIGNDKEIRALLPSETPSQGEFLTVEEKFLPGGARMITPPRLPQDAIELIQRDSEKAYRALGCKVYTRIDGFWTKRGLVILEANTLPGVTPSTCVFHQAAEEGMSAQDFFARIIELSLEAHRAKRGPL